MPMEDRRPCERRAEYEYRESELPTGKWPERCNVA
jgi:hypothetical protein